jgi:transcriptional regulator with XRE-family HTH domain
MNRSMGDSLIQRGFRLDFHRDETFDAAMSPEELGRILRQRRKSAGITQRDLAALSALGVHTLSDLESGKGNPTLDVLSRVCGVLGLEIRLGPRQIAGFAPADTGDGTTNE